MVRGGRTSDDARQVERNAAMAGIRIVSPPLEETEVWPDNWIPMRVAQAMHTQWNAGAMGGRTGLRYEALPVVLRMLGVSEAQEQDAFHGLQVIEQEVLRLGREHG